MALSRSKGNLSSIMENKRHLQVAVMCNNISSQKWLFLIVVLLHDAIARNNNALSNQHLNIAYYEWDPMFRIHKDPGGKNTYSGILGKLLTLMETQRNITFTLLKVPGGVWGNCESENNCTGMIGMVNRKEADLALGNN